jgi:hypothetical protein
VDAAPVRQMTAEEWLRVFGEADELGISFILQDGGFLDDDHAGGCVLYEKRAQVEALLNR